MRIELEKMNKILLIFLIALASCTNKETIKVNEEIDTTRIDKEFKMDTLFISSTEIELLDKFKTPLKDIAIYMKIHKDTFSIDHYYFKCGKFKFWIANGYDYFELYEPYTVPLDKIEKNYFWNIYLQVRNNKKIYNWENKIIIKEK